jgi:hypothetical protein
MNNVFWIGVYPGLTQPMLEFRVEVIRDFVAKAKTGLKTLRVAELSDRTLDALKSELPVVP